MPDNQTHFENLWRVAMATANGTQTLIRKDIETNGFDPELAYYRVRNVINAFEELVDALANMEPDYPEVNPFRTEAPAC